MLIKYKEKKLERWKFLVNLLKNIKNIQLIFKLFQNMSTWHEYELEGRHKQYRTTLISAK